MAALAACGEAPPAPAPQAVWATLEEALGRPLGLADSARRRRRTCSRGGTVEGPGSAALTAARVVGRARDRFVFTACDAGGQPVSGTVWAELEAVGGEVTPVALRGRLRLLGESGRICELTLGHDPTAAYPRRHSGHLCGHTGELGGTQLPSLRCDGSAHPACSAPEAPVAHPDRAPAF